MYDVREEEGYDVKDDNEDYWWDDIQGYATMEDAAKWMAWHFHSMWTTPRPKTETIAVRDRKTGEIRRFEVDITFTSKITEI